jgi:molecular chaperone GrpE
VTHAHDEPTPDQPVEQVDASDVVADVDSEQQLGADAAAARPADEPGDEATAESTDEPTAEPTDAPDAPADEPADEPAAGATPGVTAVETQLAERTVDLQRLQAEFLNY